ncbi:MAG: hypothetical protein ABSC62_00720 [Terracidiphilus sp.]|jgi:hypothetical protein
MGLQDCQRECIELFFKMRKNGACEQLAAPFLSTAESPATFGGRGAILLVGKATKGKWKIEDFKPDADCPCLERVQERILTARTFVGEMCSRPKSAFWRFWRDLGSIGSPVIWTNLAKIGVDSGNPQGSFLEEQSGLAVRTLRAEIAEYNPSLVVLVTSDYAKDEIVYRIWPQHDWTISKLDGSTCWIAGKDGEPPVLWTNHPQGKKRDQLNYWLTMANSLFAGQDWPAPADLN